jgi:hypothetical protein
MEGRDDSPWYPTMRLFRQEHAGDWTLVVARVAAALATLAHENAARLQAPALPSVGAAG